MYCMRLCEWRAREYAWSHWALSIRRANVGKIDETSYSSCEWRLIISMEICSGYTDCVYLPRVVPVLPTDSANCGKFDNYILDLSLQCVVTIYMQSNSNGRKRTTTAAHSHITSLIAQPNLWLSVVMNEPPTLSAQTENYQIFFFFLDEKCFVDESEKNKKKKNIFSASTSLCVFHIEGMR